MQKGRGLTVESAILDLGRAAANSIPTTGPEPKLVGFIPGKDFGRVDKSIRYLKSHVLSEPAFFHIPSEYFKPDPKNRSRARSIPPG